MQRHVRRGPQTAARAWPRTGRSPSALASSLLELFLHLGPHAQLVERLEADLLVLELEQHPLAAWRFPARQASRIVDRDSYSAAKVPSWRLWRSLRIQAAEQLERFQGGVGRFSRLGARGESTRRRSSSARHALLRVIEHDRRGAAGQALRPESPAPRAAPATAGPAAAGHLSVRSSGPPWAKSFTGGPTSCGSAFSAAIFIPSLFSRVANQ